MSLTRLSVCLSLCPLCPPPSLSLSPTVSSCWRLAGTMSSRAGGGATGRWSSSRASSSASSSRCCPSSTWSLRRAAMACSSASPSSSSSVTPPPTWPSCCCSSWPRSTSPLCRPTARGHHPPLWNGWSCPGCLVTVDTDTNTQTNTKTHQLLLLHTNVALCNVVANMKRKPNCGALGSSHPWFIF